MNFCVSYLPFWPQKIVFQLLHLPKHLLLPFLFYCGFFIWCKALQILSLPRVPCQKCLTIPSALRFKYMFANPCPASQVVNTQRGRADYQVEESARAYRPLASHFSCLVLFPFPGLFSPDQESLSLFLVSRKLSVYHLLWLLHHELIVFQTSFSSFVLFSQHILVFTNEIIWVSQYFFNGIGLTNLLQMPKAEY